MIRALLLASGLLALGGCETPLARPGPDAECHTHGAGLVSCVKPI